jgi:hypothetical protein
VTSDAPTAEATETTSAEVSSAVGMSVASDEPALAPAITPASACTGTLQACATGFECHHQEGRNIGILGCPTGQICCQF